MTLLIYNKVSKLKPNLFKKRASRCLKYLPTTLNICIEFIAHFKL